MSAAVLDDTTKRGTGESRLGGKIPRSIDELPAAAQPHARTILEHLTKGKPELRAAYERFAAGLAYLQNVLTQLAHSHVCCVNIGQMFHYLRRVIGLKNDELRELIKRANVKRSLKELRDKSQWLSLKEFEAIFWECVAVIGTADAPYELAREIREYRFGLADQLAQLMAKAASTAMGSIMLPTITQKAVGEVQNAMGTFNANKKAKVHTRRSPNNQAVIEVQLVPSLSLDAVWDDFWSQLGFVAEDIRMVPSITTGQPGFGVPKTWRELGIDLGTPEPDVTVACQQDPIQRVIRFNEWHERCPQVGHPLTYSEEGLTICVNGEPTLRKVVVTKNDPWDFQVRLVTPFDNEFAYQSNLWIATRTIVWGPDRTGGDVVVFRKGQVFGHDRMLLHMEWEIPAIGERVVAAKSRLSNEWADLWEEGKRNVLRQGLASLLDFVTFKRYRKFKAAVRFEEAQIRQMVDKAVNFVKKHQEEFANVKTMTDQGKQALLDAWKAEYEPTGETTETHVERVGSWSVATGRYIIAEQPQLRDEIDLLSLTVAAEVHDVGKITVRDEVLNKPTKLTPTENEEMAFHIIATELILDLLGYEPVIYEIAVSHHEKFRKDQGGYPNNFDGAYLSLAAQILALADFYDALRSKRSYKPAFSREKSFEIVADATVAGQYNLPLAILFLRAMLITDQPERIATGAEEAQIARLVQRAAIKQERLVFLPKAAVPEKVRQMKRGQAA